MALNTGEEYPHLFVSTNPEDVEWGESAEGSKYHAVIELTDEEWADYRQARERYCEWVEKLTGHLNRRLADRMRS